MADINLLSEEDKTSESFDNLRKKLSALSILLLVFAALGTVATLVFYTSLVSARDKIVTRVDEAAAQVDSLKNVEELAVVTVQKAQSANQVLSARSDKVKIFNELSTLVPQSVSFSDIKITQGKMVFSGKAKTSADVAAFIAALTSATGAQILTGVSVDSLSSDSSGVYNFGISATLAK